MEESGHYYTVYFTSLAVGFAEDVAYQHALLAQMPDEVGWLDAANMHINQCVGWNEFDLNSSKVEVPNHWRYVIEFGLHSLPDKKQDNTSSQKQRTLTADLLLKENPLSLEFGLLLHRLGDTFAHSIMGNEIKLYTVAAGGPECFTNDSLGHKRDSHRPDYPFLRRDLFYDYLGTLYRVLSEKVNSPDAKLYKRRQLMTISAGDIELIFRQMLDDTHGLVRSSMRGGLTDETTSLFFMEKIREASKKYLGVTMKPYAPEKIEKQTLSQFLSDHPELRSLGINQKSLSGAVNDIYSNVKSGQN